MASWSEEIAILLAEFHCFDDGRSHTHDCSLGHTLVRTQVHPLPNIAKSWGGAPSMCVRPLEGVLMALHLPAGPQPPCSSSGQTISVGLVLYLVFEAHEQSPLCKIFVCLGATHSGLLRGSGDHMECWGFNLGLPVQVKRPLHYTVWAASEVRTFLN